MNSVAEAELLMQLAALTVPEKTPIAEMFRNFPAPEGWGWELFGTGPEYLWGPEG